MGEFNPIAGIFWMSVLAYVISFYFFLKAILLNGEAWKKKLPYNPKAIVPTIWGFAFGILGHLGVFIIAG